MLHFDDHLRGAGTQEQGDLASMNIDSPCWPENFSFRNSMRA
jgi:hypothetical protein